MAPVKPVLAVKSTLSGPAAEKQHRCPSESSNQPQHNNQSIMEVSCKGVYEIQLSDQPDFPASLSRHDAPLMQRNIA